MECWQCSLLVAPRYQVLNLKFENCILRVRRTSNEVKISIEDARLACPETKDEPHLLPLNSSVCSHRRVWSRVPVLRLQYVRLNKNALRRENQAYSWWCFAYAWWCYVPLECAQSRRCRKQGSDGRRCNKLDQRTNIWMTLWWLSDLLVLEDGFRWKYGHKYCNVVVDKDKCLRVLQLAFLLCELTGDALKLPSRQNATIAGWGQMCLVAGSSANTLKSWSRGWFVVFGCSKGGMWVSMESCSSFPPLHCFW